MVAVWFSVMFFIGGVALLRSGIRQLVRGLRQPDHADAPLWLARGLREVLIVVCGTVIGIGLSIDSPTTWMVGAVILAEELYEIGVALLILEHGRATA